MENGLTTVERGLKQKNLSDVSNQLEWEKYYNKRGDRK